VRGETEELRRGGVRAVELSRAVALVRAAASGDEAVSAVDTVRERCHGTIGGDGEDAGAERGRRRALARNGADGGSERVGRQVRLESRRASNGMETAHDQGEENERER